MKVVNVHEHVYSYIVSCKIDISIPKSTEIQMSNAASRYMGFMYTYTHPVTYGHLCTYSYSAG